jgi:hypothetical protein
MGYLPSVVGVIRADGTRVDQKRADGTRAPILLAISTEFVATSTEVGGLTHVTLSAVGGGRHEYGIAGRQTNNNDTPTVRGALVLSLGTAGLPTLGRTLELEAIISTSDVGNATLVDFYNLTTSQVVGSALTLAASLTPGRVTLDVTAEIGTSLSEDVDNVIVVRIYQTATDAAETAICDMARINAGYA